MTATETNPIIVQQKLKAPISSVWKAISDPGEMKLWYFDLPEFKAETGAEFQFYGGTPEKQYLHLCQVQEVAPKEKLSYSWRYEGYDGNSLVTFALVAEGETTKLTLTHEGLETFPAGNPDFARSNFLAGWTEIIQDLLRNFVEN